MSSEIVPFDPSMLPAAGTLMALRQQRLRSARPELPAAVEDPEVARTAVEAVWTREGARGVAARQGGRLRGYLIGDLVLDNLWGRSAWVRLAGCALAPEEDPELARDLYAALAARWVASGCFAHFALIPCGEEALVRAWFALGFGIEQVHALAALDNLDLRPACEPPDVEIRRAGPADRGLLEELSDIIWRHQVKAPVWGIHLPEQQACFRARYGDLAADPEAVIWLAFHQGRAAGFQAYFPAETHPGDPLIPEHCIELGVAGTRDWARGKGIGRALTQRGLAEALSAGYRCCLTDWRSTNLLSSRFFPRRGFRPAVYRLARRIDPRITWAGEARPW